MLFLEQLQTQLSTRYVGPFMYFLCTTRLCQQHRSFAEVMSLPEAQVSVDRLFSSSLSTVVLFKLTALIPSLKNRSVESE